MSRIVRDGTAEISVVPNDRYRITRTMTPENASNGKRGAANKAWLRALEATAHIGADPTLTLPRLIGDLAQRLGDRPALISRQETLSFHDLAERVNRYARWAIAEGIRAGDVVALLMPNSADYLAVWLGIGAVGGITALINTELRSGALAYSLGIAAPKHIIVAAALAEPLISALPDAEHRPQLWIHGAADLDWPRVDTLIGPLSGSPLDPAERIVRLGDPALYIYTSGTTGMPKAAIVSHRRILAWSLWFAGLLDVSPADRMYDCLPMHHSVGGVVAIGATLARGGSVVIRERFSAREFWDDIVDCGCTLFQYIGELARYLVNAPPHPLERRHRLRLAVGNGLKRDVWEAFQARFGVPQILEFYAATEGNVSLYNCEGRPGAVGRIPPFLAHRFPLALVRFDVETGLPQRGPDGFCIRCAPDEVGEAIGRIGADSPFEGYTNAEDSERKILRDVFAPGDAWFRTGDLMRRDASGFFSFVDRIGDTFRWKGENVSTTEVAECIAACPGVVEANVYGVAVPGMEGRAGMAALVTNGPLDLARLHRHLVENLPAYARPRFLRLRPALATTATFKPTKHDLVREGFDPAVIAEPLYVDDATSGTFMPLDHRSYEEICAGGMRL